MASVDDFQMFGEEVHAPEVVEVQAAQQGNGAAPWLNWTP
jgi:hypothetical protein